MSYDATAFICDTHEQAISTLSIDDSTQHDDDDKNVFQIAYIRERTIDIGKVSRFDLLNTFAVEAKGMFIADVECRASNGISDGMSKTQKPKEMKTDKVCRILDTDADDDIVRHWCCEKHQTDLIQSFIVLTMINIHLYFVVIMFGCRESDIEFDETTRAESVSQLRYR